MVGKMILDCPLYRSIISCKSQGAPEQGKMSTPKTVSIMGDSLRFSERHKTRLSRENLSLNPKT